MTTAVATGRLTAETPRAPYIPHKVKARRPADRSFRYLDLHWGQRKLFLGELLFLTQAVTTEEPYHCLYVGAANGEHLPFLADLFPQVQFHLYDPAPFHAGLVAFAQQTGRVTIHSQLFTDEEVARYGDYQNLLFISDIRHDVGNEAGKEQRFEEAVLADMAMQRAWVERLQPLVSSLKFRLPYPQADVEPQYEYLSGTVWFQPWAPVTSTECRLFVPRGAQTELYDIKRYEEQCAWFNQRRTARLPRGEQVNGLNLNAIWQGLVSHLGLDCRLETEILLAYFAVEDEATLRAVVTRLNEELHGTFPRKLKQ
jgi:hypothetical protein